MESEDRGSVILHLLKPGPEISLYFLSEFNLRTKGAIINQISYK